MSGGLALPGIEAIRPIGYGERLRLGVILPSGNVIAEPQIRAMLPPGVGFYVTRLALRGTPPAELLHMIDGVEAAAMLLADARVDAIVFHCTAVTTFSPIAGAAIRGRIDAATGIPGIVTSDALTAALAAVSLRRITLLTTYTQPTHRREIGSFAIWALPSSAMRRSSWRLTRTWPACSRRPWPTGSWRTVTTAPTIIS